MGLPVMSDETICGACKGAWPCACSDRAVPVTIMDTSSELAERMRSGRIDPLAIKPYDPDPPIKAELWSVHHCGHHGARFDVDLDKRVVTCRHCEAQLDPYSVLEKLAGMMRGESMRLQACQELEQREAQREGERLARAKVRRHHYAHYSRRRGTVAYCATCGGQEADAIHT